MIEQFKNHQDCRKTWAAIYQAGGEPLLREWSKQMFAAGKAWHDDQGMEFHHGLRLYQALNYIGADDDEVLSLIHLVPIHQRPILLDNPNAGLKIIEALWYGPYQSRSGRVVSDIGAMTAFMNLHDLAMQVFRTRPELAKKLSPEVYSLFDFAAKREDRQSL